jgi:hypothetical protein
VPAIAISAGAGVTHTQWTHADTPLVTRKARLSAIANWNQPLEIQGRRRPHRETHCIT